MAERIIPAGVEKEDGYFVRVAILLSFCYLYMITKKTELVKCMCNCTLSALSISSSYTIICKKR